MSTRCQIGFYSKPDYEVEDFDNLIYRHSDGYPGDPAAGDPGVVVDLLPFLVRFQNSRGLADSEYAAAWTVWYLCDQYKKSGDEFYEKMREADPSYKRQESFLGHGICSKHGFHGDIEFFYAVHPDGLDVYSVDYGASPQDWNKFVSYVVTSEGWTLQEEPEEELEEE